MSRLADNLVDIFKVVANDPKMLRLLYYPSDPLNSTKAEVNTLEDFYKIKKSRIIRAPKTDDITPTSEKICRICMYFGNGSNTPNERVDDQDVIFDIYTHIDTYEANEARSLKIIDQLNELLALKHVTGIGKMRTSKRYIIANAPSGYMGYKVVFEFGSTK